MSEFGQLPGQQFYLELSIKGERYNPNNIQYFVIREWIFNILPTIELMLADEGYLTEADPLEDGSEIEVLLAKSEDDPNPLEMTFLVDDYTVEIMGDNRKSLVSITGHLKVDKMFEIQSRSFSKRNSAEVLQQIASECGLKFSNPRNITPTDNMVWLQASVSNQDFIGQVLKRSYIPNDCTFFYGNHNNEFVYTSLLTEMEKQEIKKTKFNIENFERFSKDDQDKDNTIWFGSYSIVNYSGYFNKKLCYGFEYDYYDLDGNNVFQEYSDIKKLTELSFRNKKNINGVFLADNVKDYIASNVYGEKYFESFSRNDFLKDNFFSNSVVLSVNSLSQVNLMDILDVDIPSLIEAEQSNEVMSGFYLVCGIQHEVTNGSIYRKKVAIGRNGMNKSANVKDYEVD